MIIGFCGRAGAGKSTAAAHLVRLHGFRRERFAGPLKDMCRALGLTEAEIEGDRKELPSELLCGKTPRQAMITLGTEWGRELVHPDLWVSAWRRRVLATPGNVVADDVRFANEAAAIRAMRGVIVRVRSTRADAAPVVHESEAMPFVPDVEIVNDGSLFELAIAVDALRRTESWAQAAIAS